MKVRWLLPSIVGRGSEGLFAQDKRGVCVFVLHSWGGLYCIYSTLFHKHGWVWWQEHWIPRPEAVTCSQELSPTHPLNLWLPRPLRVLILRLHVRRQPGTKPWPSQPVFSSGPEGFMGNVLHFLDDTAAGGAHCHLPNPVLLRADVCLGPCSIWHV